MVRLFVVIIDRLGPDTTKVTRSWSRQVSSSWRKNVEEVANEKSEGWVIRLKSP